MSEELKVWVCKIIVSGDTELPNGFDRPPRKAVMEAVESHGIDVLGCSSGWGGSLTKDENEAFKHTCGDVYFAGLLDDSSESTH